ncbi:hypothetical protein CTI12_AA064440 [Artemisia annua]|uniref:Uncharacterized protein n=1 Tax=Artemisia annua TaxID=35608 RepID=A0A2U1Q7J8_ARTAN|nr:hypothetical protein CTI12_AA064440 [Artemisia annua]
MDGVEYEDEESDAGELKEEGFAGDVVSSVDAQSIDSRSCGDSVSEREAHGVSEKDKVSNVLRNSVNVSKAIENMMGPIPVPVSDNPILNPRPNHVISPRILKRGEVLSDGVVLLFPITVLKSGLV